MSPLRRLTLWLHSERYPGWRIPEASVRAVEEAAGAGWEVRAVREDQRASGDGPARVPEAVLAAVADAEAYVGFGIAPATFAAAPRLRWVHSCAAGVRGSLFPALRGSDVVLTNSAGVYAEPLAEWAVAAMLHFARGLDIAAAARPERRWPYDEMAGETGPLRELSGAVLAVVGWGGIGRAAGRKARALGMRVLALRRRPELGGDGIAEEIVGPEALHDLLSRADYVLLSLPETVETTGLVGAAELARMPDRAVLINLSRGGIVDEEALARALHGRTVRGAALDVFRQEPLPRGSPLWDRDNVLITPHAGAVSDRFWERQTALLTDNVRRYAAGRPLRNVVDKQRGY